MFRYDLRLTITLVAALAMAGCFGAPSDGKSSSSSGTNASSATTAHGSSSSSSHSSSSSTASGSGSESGSGSGSGSDLSSGNSTGPSGSATGTTDATTTTGTSNTSGTGTSEGQNTGTNSTGTTDANIGTGTNSTGTTNTTNTTGVGFAATTGPTSTGTTGTNSTTTSTGTFTTGHTGTSGTSSTTSVGTHGTSGTTTTNTVGTTGTTGHNTSTSIGTSTSTSTSTGSTSSGTTGTGDCRSNGCGYGETCEAFPSSSGTIWLCACTVANSQTTGDSCAGNPNGDTVCDPDTYACSAPTDYAPCNPQQGTSACALGYTCVGSGSPGSGTCLQNCNSTSDCHLAYEQCLGQSSGHGLCQIDICGPNNFGLPPNGNFYGACDLATDAGDGFCQPFADGQGGLIGYCMGSGPVQTGGFCPGFGVDASEQCVAGDICYSFGLRLHDGGVANQCFIACDASQPGNPCPGNSACYPNDPTSQTSPDPGICFP